MAHKISLAKNRGGDLLESFMSQPIVASYCTTFLKREMRHIYRQVTGLRDFQTFVMTKSRENTNLFPFADVEVLPRPRINFLLRFHKKYIQQLEPVFYRGEYDQLDNVLSRRRADLLHVYFGHTGVHLLPFLRNWPKPSLVSFHGMDIMLRDEEPDYNKRLRELLEVVPLVLARSESLAARLMELGCDAKKLRINRTGVPMEGFPYFARSLPPDGAWRMIQASRFIEKKGLDTTLRAFADFRARYPRRNSFWRVKVRSKRDSKRVLDASASLTPFVLPVFSVSRNSQAPTALPIFSYIQARLPKLGIRKGFPTRCSKPWPADYPW